MNVGGDAPRTSAPKTDKPLDALYKRPGFLIRRANQIAVWLFLDEASPITITPTQYGALVILGEFAGIDQIGLSKLLSIDKSTAALVASKLEAAGWVRRQADPRDRRRNVLRITAAGVQVLRDMAGPADRARRRLLTVFDEREARRFLALLERYVTARQAEPPPPGRQKVPDTKARNLTG